MNKKGQNLQWGSVLGEAHNVKGYSNLGFKYDPQKWNSYKSILKKAESGLARDVILGVKYQCVEYARRFMVINYAAAFREIHCAYEIFQLNTVDDLTTPAGFLQFLTFPNGSPEPPIIGDLIIYPKTTKQPYGHVAVIVDIGNGFVCVAEQNYEDSGWVNQNYSRKLKINTANGHYQITQIRIGLEHQNQYWWDKNEQILGWKRVVR